MSKSGRWRQPRRVAAAIKRVRRETAPPTLLARVQDCWAECVGVDVSEEGRPVTEHDGIVTVSCRSAVWAAELSMLSQELLAKLNTRLGGDAEVKGLRFTTESI